MKWFVYLAKCKDGSIYTGITNNLKRREWLHNNKLGAKTLYGKLPIQIIYNEPYINQKEAAQREREIKGWRKEKKLLLINN